MILQIADWVFDVDVDATAVYSDAEAMEHCTCEYCRNFYAALHDVCPAIPPFLLKFGINSHAPDKMSAYELGGNICYDGVFSICGRILTSGKSPLLVDGVEIIPANENELHLEQVCPGPRFLLIFNGITLPWVLDEPVENAISSEYVSEMWDTFYGKSGSCS